MDGYRGQNTDIIIDLHGDLYVAIIMDSYGGTDSALNIALHGGL
jgi:hypothetical protein